jgi:hypothetical protein
MSKFAGGINLQVGKGGLPPPNSHEGQAGVNHPSQPANYSNCKFIPKLEIYFGISGRLNVECLTIGKMKSL